MSEKEKILAYLQVKNDLDDLEEMGELLNAIKQYKLDYTADIEYPKNYEEYMHIYNKNLSLVGSFFREPIPEEIWNKLKNYFK